MNANEFIEVTEEHHREKGEERYFRHIDDKCWISVLYRLTGFGRYEWETALVFIIEEGSRPKRWKSDDRDILIIAGDRREELKDIPKEKLREWYENNIDGNRNSMETLLEIVKKNQTLGLV